MIKSFFLGLSSLLLMASCLDSRATNSETNEVVSFVEDSLTETIGIIDSTAMIVKTRFPIPDGFNSVSSDNQYANYLRSLELYPIEHDVLYFDGTTKSREGVYCSVVKLPIGKRDRHQCADAIMNVRAHYFYNSEQYDQIHFNFTNGFRADYSKWREGKRINVAANQVNYYQTSKESTTYESFLAYLQKVYCYAGTYSLSKELVPTDIYNIEPGNVFIKGGFPGHAVLVLDVVENSDRERQFILAQSYMPAQELQILINPNSEEVSPWYKLSEIDNEIYTPEWTFSIDQLKRFK
jgi:hypothetical protein